MHAADLRDAVHEERHFLSEFRADAIKRRFGIFHGIVQEAGSDGGGIQFPFRQDLRRRDRVDEVRFAAFAFLPAMRPFGERVRPADEPG